MKNFSSLPKFEKEFKRLCKKYKTLDDDLEKLKRVLAHCPTGIGKSFIIIHSTETIKIVKARMAYRELREQSIRIIYAYFEQEQKIEFIELYYKGNKENEDRERIGEFLKKYQS